MCTHSICFCGEIKDANNFGRKVPFLYRYKNNLKI